MLRKWRLREWLRDAALDALLSLVQLVEPCKNRGLAAKLRDLADCYDL